MNRGGEPEVGGRGRRDRSWVLALGSMIPPAQGANVREFAKQFLSECGGQLITPFLLILRNPTPWLPE